MSETFPSVARADADGDGPAKRTRRPALSCVECRVRKVKCDRKEPCGACIRTRSDQCTYRSSRRNIRPAAVRSSEIIPTFVANDSSNDPNSARSSRSSVDVGQRPIHDVRGSSSERPTAHLDAHAGDTESSLISTLLKENRDLRSAVARGASENDSLPISEVLTDIPGSFQKSKFFGQSHWMNALEPYEALGNTYTTINPATDRVEVNKSTELYKTVNELKTMARVLKSSRLLLPTISPEALNSLPAKATCDALLAGYLRTFEGVFRVLHVPSFRKEYDDYWSGIGSEKPSVLLKIMLACAIGVPFYTGADQPRLRVASVNWVQAAENWLAAPHAKSRLNMAGLQIQILVLIAKQVCNIEGDHIWIPAGALLRTAMYLGLHRDPTHFGKINTFHAEMRRRLWATVLELSVQSSLDMGMPPPISVQDYDTKPPSNINDEDISEGNDAPLVSRPAEINTASSLQIAFLASLPQRLDILRLVNSLHSTISYPTCLRLGTQLTQLCDSQTQFFKASLLSPGKRAHTTPFAIKLLDSLTRRFALNLHRPFFAQAATTPQYHFSRQFCLDASLALCAPTSSNPKDDWTLLTHRASGFFKALILYAVSTVYFELHTQLSEHMYRTSLTAPLVSSPSSFSDATLPPSLTPLLSCLQSAHDISLARIHAGETNPKGVLFFACALARIDALLSGSDPEVAVLAAAKSEVRVLREVMRNVYVMEHSQGVHVGIDASMEREREREGEGFGRGEGADDVTGRNGRTGTGDDGHGDGHVEGGFEHAIHGMSVELADGQSSSSTMQYAYGYGFEDDGTAFSDAFLLDPEGFFGGEMWGAGAGGGGDIHGGGFW